MGPRSDERGNPGFLPATPKSNDPLQWGRAPMSAEICPGISGVEGAALASMGPRSDERGNGARRAVRSRIAAASMGPRSDERGNMRMPWCGISASSQLQWGRAPMSAEMIAREGGDARQDRASMGPRSDERGNSEIFT